MSGNGDAGGSPASMRGPARSAMFAIVGAGLEGQVTVTATVQLLHSSGPVMDLTPSGAFVGTADLEGSQEPLVASEIVLAGQYEAVRIMFEEVTADVTGGLEIDGLPFVGQVTVDLSGGDLLVMRTLDLDVLEGEQAAFVIDLDADAWVPLLDVLTGTVLATDFASAVSVSLR
jgi:hypothetical protein